MKNRILSLIVAVIMILGMLPGFVFAANTDFAGGDGTAQNPYLISTKAHLDNVRNYLDSHFKMIRDIEFNDADFESGGKFYNGGQGWMPIGKNGFAFTGTFDGNGYVIKNLHIYACCSSGYVGLFGYNKGTIKNLGVIDGSIYVESSFDMIYIGGIAGFLYCGVIENCHNSNEIVIDSYGTDVKVGGIVGENISGEVSKCFHLGEILVDSEIIAKINVGGIAGQNWGTISNSYNLGEISVSAYYSFVQVGGITGEGWGTIENCYNTGLINAFSLGSSLAGDSTLSAGGIAGEVHGKITNCYNIGTISAKSLFLLSGGIAGSNESGSVTINCYYLNNISKGIGSGTGNAVECTSAQMQKEETFVGFDFGSVWTMDADTLYPFPTLIGLPMDNFTDVPVNAWYKTFVDYAVENGIFAGKGEGKFAPDANITRAEFVQVLANITGVDLSTYKSHKNFGDVKTTDWYSGAVNWAYENGIVSGTGYGSFSPNAKITREQMCVMLVNYVENYCESSLNETVAVSTFADDNKISGWAKNAVYKCAKAGLVSGVGNGKFDPNSSASRAQGATIFTNFHKSYIK